MLNRYSSWNWKNYFIGYVLEMKKKGSDIDILILARNKDKIENEI